MAMQWPSPYIIACYWYGVSPLLLPHPFFPISLLSFTPTEIQALIAQSLVIGVSETHRMLSVYLGGDEV